MTPRGYKGGPVRTDNLDNHVQPTWQAATKITACDGLPELEKLVAAMAAAAAAAAAVASQANAVMTPAPQTII